MPVPVVTGQREAAQTEYINDLQTHMKLACASVRRGVTPAEQR